MKNVASTTKYDSFHNTRFLKTISFLNQFDLKSDQVLNLGPENPLSILLREEGYHIDDTKEGVDLDLDFSVVSTKKYNTVFAFEILEHLVSPFPLLKSIKADKLVVTVPLSLWFAKAYWNEKDPYDRHYHEFEPRQLEMLLNKAGWEIKSQEFHTSEINQIGIRPFLRKITPRYYFVYCERIERKNP